MLGRKKDEEGKSSVTAAFIAMANRPVRVLLVEDDANIRIVLNAMFESYNVEVMEAFDRVQACQLAEATTFDLALIDMRLPWPGNGVAVMRALNARAPDLPICVYSGNLTPEDIEGSVQAAGVVTFVPKRFLSREYIVNLFRKFGLASRAGMLATALPA